MDWFELTDLPQLQSVKLGDYAFENIKSFEMSNLTSIQLIDFGSYCFRGSTYRIASFTLISVIH